MALGFVYLDRDPVNVNSTRLSFVTQLDGKRVPLAPQLEIRCVAMKALLSRRICLA